jgi:hypothetical protein
MRKRNKPYLTCKNCGAHIDFGEQCDCEINNIINIEVINLCPFTGIKNCRNCVLLRNCNSIQKVVY